MRTVLKWIGIVLGVLVGLVVVAAGFIYFKSEAILNKKYDAPQVSVTVPTDAASVERGHHLATAMNDCVGCHGANLAGGIVLDDPALGRIVAPNLTRGQNGLGNQLSDSDIARVLRYGVLPNGHSVRVMPANDYSYLTDSDVGALIALVRSMPAVDTHLPRTEVRWLGRVLLAAGQLPIMVADRIDFEEAGSPDMTPNVSVDYGHYLANISGCTNCHGPTLSGGHIIGTPPDWPQAANITPAGVPAQWSEADFINTIRTGVDPSGHHLIDEMPWKTFRNMSDDELRAVWAFVHSVPPKEFGNR